MSGQTFLRSDRAAEHHEPPTNALVRNSASPRSAPSPKLSPARFFSPTSFRRSKFTFIPLGTSDVLVCGFEGWHHRTPLCCRSRRPFSPWMRAFASSPPARIFYRAVQGGLNYNEGNHFSNGPSSSPRRIRATQRALRLIRNDKKFAIEFIRGPIFDLGKDRDPARPTVFYDAALQYYLQSGVVDEKLQRENDSP